MTTVKENKDKINEILEEINKHLAIKDKLVKENNEISEKVAESKEVYQNYIVTGELEKARKYKESINDLKETYKYNVDGINAMNERSESFLREKWSKIKALVLQLPTLYSNESQDVMDKFVKASKEYNEYKKQLLDISKENEAYVYGLSSIHSEHFHDLGVYNELSNFGSGTVYNESTLDDNIKSYN